MYTQEGRQIIIWHINFITFMPAFRSTKPRNYQAVLLEIKLKSFDSLTAKLMGADLLADTFYNVLPQSIT